MVEKPAGPLPLGHNHNRTCALHCLALILSLEIVCVIPHTIKYLSNKGSTNSFLACGYLLSRIFSQNHTLFKNIFYWINNKIHLALFWNITINNSLWFTKAHNRNIYSPLSESHSQGKCFPLDPCSILRSYGQKF